MKKSSDPDIRNKENEVMPDIASVNTQHRGKYHYTADLLFILFSNLNEQQFYLFGLIQTSQTRG